MTAPQTFSTTDLAGILYVVATPIGNLDDISYRAVQVLQSVDAIVVERARHSQKLFAAHDIHKPFVTLADHNEQHQSGVLVERLRRGESLALISDAGTPLISDPGFRLVAQARAQGLRVSPVPGPCAAIAALSVSGLSCEKFLFEGFLPEKAVLRQKRLQALYTERRTWIAYEAPHRIQACLADMRTILGELRQVVLARELTKQFEQVIDGPLVEIESAVSADANLRRGEMVLLVSGYNTDLSGVDEGALRQMLLSLLEILPMGKAVQVAAKLTGQPRARLNQLAIEIRGIPD